MKKLLYLIAILILGLNSCDKEDSAINEESSKETFVWEGETFDVGEFRTNLALIMGIDENQLEFRPDSLAFQWHRPRSSNVILIYVKDFVEIIKNFEN